MKKSSQLEIKLARFLIANTNWYLVFRTLTRTHAGHWQKKTGAWTWWAYITKGKQQLTVGSQYPLNKLMKDMCNVEISWTNNQMILDPILLKKGKRR